MFSLGESLAGCGEEAVGDPEGFPPLPPHEALVKGQLPGRPLAVNGVELGDPGRDGEPEALPLDTRAPRRQPAKNPLALLATS